MLDGATEGRKFFLEPVGGVSREIGREECYEARLQPRPLRRDTYLSAEAFSLRVTWRGGVSGGSMLHCGDANTYDEGLLVFRHVN